MKKSVIFFLLLSILSWCCTMTVSAQFASATWPLTASTNPQVPVFSGNITAFNQTSSGTSPVITYSTVSGINAKGWPTSANLDPARYIQFSVMPNAGYALKINDISIVGSSNDASAKFDIRYSADSNFNIFSTLISGIGMRSTDSNYYWFNRNILVNSNSKIFFRVFAYAVTNNKYTAFKNLNISGVTTLCTGFNTSNFGLESTTPTCTSLADSSRVAVNSTTLLSGNYIVTYNLLGANSAIQQTANLTFFNGSPGSGSFFVPRSLLNNAGTTTLVITQLSTAEGCNAAFSSNNTIPILVNGSVPPTPSVFSGPLTVCPNAAVTYSVAPVAGATSYFWSFPSGWMPSSGGGQPSIDLVSGDLGQNGNITVSSRNSCGLSTPLIKAITVSTSPTPLLTSAATAAVCTNSLFSYTAQSSNTSVVFTWSRDVVSGVSNVASSGTGAAISETLVNTTSGPVNVIYRITMKFNGCSATSDVTVTVNPYATIDVQPQSQTICAGLNVTFSALASGTSPISYLWQESQNGGGFSNISGANSSTLVLPVTNMMNGNRYQVIVSSGCGPSLISSIATLNVPAAIVNNIGSNQTLCSNSIPNELNGNYSGGNGAYLFQWQKSILGNNTGFVSIAAGGAGYAPGPLAQTNWFRRIVYSGSCSQVSAAVQISIFDSIQSNTIAANQTICLGSSTNPLIGSIPTGGNGVYNYLWERNVISANVGFDRVGTAQNYAPGSLQQSAYFRRIVNSGVCTDTSVILTINVVSTNAAITPDSAELCNGEKIMLTSRGLTVFDFQDFSDNARGWYQANELNSGGLAATNSVNNGSGNSNDWVRYSTGNSFNGFIYQTSDNSDFLMSQSNRPGFYTQTLLISPVIHPAAISDFFIHFDHTIRNVSAQDFCNVEVSTDNINWTVVKKYLASAGSSDNFLPATTNLSAYKNFPDVYIRLRYYGYYGGWWAIDNLSIDGYNSIQSNYAWSPATGLFTDAAATIPYVSGSGASVVYAKPSVSTTYSIGASGGSCLSQYKSVISVVPTRGLVSVTGSGSFCNAATVSASDNEGRTIYYQFTNANGFLTSNQSSSVNVTASGTYYFRALSASGCWTSPGSATVVISTAPSIVTKPVAHNVCIGTADTLRVVAAGTGISYQWYSSIDNGNSFQQISNGAGYSGAQDLSLIIAAVNINLLNVLYKVAVLTPSCGSASSNPAIALKPKSVWIGSNGNNANSIDWFRNANWSDGVVPTLNGCSEIVIPGGKTSYPVISPISAIQVKNINILTGGSLIINGKMGVAGNINNSGTLNILNGTLELNGSSSPQIISGSYFLQKEIKNFIINNPTGVSLSATPNDTLKINGLLSFGNVNTTFNINNNLTLLSDSSNTASVADLTNNGLHNNSIIGNAVVERYINSGRKWRFLSIPTNTTQSFKESWQEENASGLNNRPGYGTMLSDQNNSTFLARGFDFVSPGGPGVKSFSSSLNAYVAIGSTFDNIATEQGYMVFVRGDRAAMSSNSLSSSTILRTKGSLKQGTQSPINVDAGGYASIGNPYASPINMQLIEKSGGVQDYFYLWDPKTGGNYGVGGFQTFYRAGDGNFYPVPGSGSYPSATAAYNFIESGQAFFVKAIPGSDGSVTIKEKHKGTQSRNVFRIGSLLQQINISLFSQVNGASRLNDGALVMLDSSYYNGIDIDDAIKLTNTGLSVSIKRENQLLAIERRNVLSNYDTIFINVSGMYPQTYKWELNVQNLNLPGRIAMLHDNYLNSNTVLDLNSSTEIQFIVDNNVGSNSPSRFFIICSYARPVPVTITHVSAKRNNDKTISVSWNVENEFSLSYYMVERSADGITFENMGEKIMALNASGAHTYRKIDLDPFAGINFYRVKAVSQDGLVQYSSIVKVASEKSGPSLEIIPNPIVDQKMNLRISNIPAGKYSLQLLNISGQIMMKDEIKIDRAVHSKSYQLEGLSAGTYQLLIYGLDGNVFTANVVCK